MAARLTQGSWAAVGCVDVKPQVIVFADVRNLLDWIDCPGVRSSGIRHDEKRFIALIAINPDCIAEGFNVDPKILIRIDCAYIVARNAALDGLT